MDRERVETYAGDEKPGVNNIKCVVGVGDAFDSVTLFKLGVAGDFWPSSPVGCEVDTETRDLGELGSHFDDPYHQLWIEEKK